MKDPRPDAFPENAAGRFYIDTTCVICGLCPAMVPDIFRESEDVSHSYVVRQPSSPEEVSQAEEMAARCPTNSIKEDGHVFSEKQVEPQTA